MERHLSAPESAALAPHRGVRLPLVGPTAAAVVRLRRVHLVESQKKVPFG